MTPISRRVTLVGLSALGVAACLPIRAATTHQIAIQGMAFSPAELSIAVGDSVTFTNLDGPRHTATADAGGFDTGKLTKGQSATVTFSAVGDFAYHCEIHKSMKAMIRVG